MTDDLETRLAVALQGAAGGTGWSIEDATFDARLILAALPAHGLVLRLASEPDALLANPASSSQPPAPEPDALRAALRPWLRHHNWCNCQTDDPPNTERCKCGLRAALSTPAPDALRALADALAVVFSYNESNASMDSRGSSTLNGEGTSYWRDRAEAVRAALSSPAPEAELGTGPGWFHDEACTDIHDDQHNCLDEQGSIIGWRDYVTDARILAARPEADPA